MDIKTDHVLTILARCLAYVRCTAMWSGLLFSDALYQFSASTLFPAAEYASPKLKVKV